MFAQFERLVRSLDWVISDQNREFIAALPPDVRKGYASPAIKFLWFLLAGLSPAKTKSK